MRHGDDDLGTDELMLLALLLFWTAPALTCRGTVEASPLTYLVGYRWGFMHYSPDCPLDPDGKLQTCPTWITNSVAVSSPLAVLPDPGRDEVIAYNLDDYSAGMYVVAVDSAGNRSDETCN